MKKILITIIAEDDKFETSSFMNEFITFQLSKSAKEYHIKDLYYEEKRFFELTEDERIILHYVDNRYTHIERNDGLFLIDYETEHLPIQLSFEMYSHLFQFIKERRRI